jgi:hypothetical protein
MNASKDMAEKKDKKNGVWVVKIAICYSNRKRYVKKTENSGNLAQ